MPIRLLFSFLLLIQLLPAGVSAGELAAYFDKVHTLRAHFTQHVLEKGRQKQKPSTGVLAIRKPDRFYLEYQTPYKQVYVADGEKLWSYDEDLEQVTVNRQAGLLQNTPALVLSDPDALEKDYQVMRIADQKQDEAEQQKELTSFSLKPKSENSQFEEIILRFDDKRLASMELHDSFGQVTYLIFTKQQINPILSDSTFKFRIPEGVDVIRADENL